MQLPPNLQTPRQLGYRMPAEWEPHARCWMAWPHSPVAWRGRHPEAKAALLRLAATIAEWEPVMMLVHPEDVSEVRPKLPASVELLPIPLDDAWTRDTLPTFLVDGKGHLAAVSWKFNGWGDMEHAEWELDESLAPRLCHEMGIPCFSAPLVNEGGAIHVDGEGTLLCTRDTLLDPRRNPLMQQNDVEQVLHEYLGAEKILWLDRGYDQDETGGHIDIIASFAAPGRILHLQSLDPADPNAAQFSRNMQALSAMRDAASRSLEIIPIPQPAPRYADSRRLSLSYQNYYPANGAVILPVFNDLQDTIALEAFRTIYPDREIVPFHATELFHGGGGIHCLTQQQPRVSL
jgi:agmatine deiminase